MKKISILSILLVALATVVFGQKNTNAWKSEQNLEQQYQVFKKNLDYWDGKYILTGAQLDEYYNAVDDSVSALENEITDKASRIDELQNELSSASSQLENANAELETSIENQNAIEVFGMNIEKGIYTLFMSLLILALLILLAVVFLLYTRSNKVTVRTEKDYEELKQEFEAHKKNALERYTKLNMELHHTRMGKNKL